MKRLARLLCASMLLTSTTAYAEGLYGLTNLQELVTFDSDTRSVTSTVGLSGFATSGDFLRSIDVRPATGQLYGLSNLGGLYQVNTTTGALTSLGTIPGLTGNARAMDFNPTVDRVRVLTSSGQNLRVHPETVAVTTDTNLAFAVGDANSGTPAVVNGAYTNSFVGATTTTLYDLEAANNVLVTQAPPNDGTLNTIGSIGFDLVDSSGFVGFDISGASGTAYLVGNSLFGGGLTVNSLYTVNLATGAASLAGAVSCVNGSFRDLAVVAQPVPEPASVVMALGGLSVLVAVCLRRRRRLQGAGSPA
jgi:hypothetical protein